MTVDEALDLVSSRTGNALPSLTATQRAHVVAVLEGDEECAVLEGPAGSGKTTVLTWLILATGVMDCPVYVCAPTHKAAAVLRRKLAPWGHLCPLPTPTTIHSLLGLKMRRTKPGGPLEAVSSGAYLGLEEGALLIIDECSMISLSLMQVIEEVAGQYQLQVLFAGDPCQLQPVNEGKRSKTFKVKPRLVLEEVLRHDGAILDLATKVRELGFVPVIKPAQGDSSEVCVHRSYKEMADVWLRELQRRFREGTEDEVVMLTYTNQMRRSFNDSARRALYGKSVERFSVGDTVMALEPVMGKTVDKQPIVLIRNNQDMVINEVMYFEALEPVPGLGVTFKTWRLTVTIRNEEEVSETRVVHVLAEGEEANYKKALSSVKTKILSASKASSRRPVAPARRGIMAAARAAAPAEDARAGWSKYYYPLEEFYASVDYKYASTIHKAQGDEWQSVYVNNDYTKSREEAVQLLYVAATRAQRTLHHIDNSPRRGA
jgi:exodeoxyribonuclease V